MIPLSEVAVLDANAAAAGISVERLMENAGSAVAEHVARMAGPEGVVVLAGPGNNGGDGLVAARLLAERMRVRVLTPVAADGWRTPAAQRAFELLPRGVEVATKADADVLDAALSQPCVVVDALLGAGISGPLREPYDGWVARLAKGGRRVVSVDVPTGFGTPTTFVPDTTVTFHDVKEGMSERNSGRIEVADIGIPPEVARRTGPGEYLLYPQPKSDQHKGEGGIVLILGGGPYTGAPAVAGLAALRTGADLAIVLTPQRAWQVVASYSPNLIVRPLHGDEMDFEDPANRVTLNMWLKKAHSVIVGPGLGLFERTQRGVHHALERAAKEGKRIVVDADALTAISERKDLLTAHTVVTPHAKEFRGLSGTDLPTDPEARVEAARLAASGYSATWLVKGPVDVVTDGERVKLNETGHPAMSVGGSGDALAGIVGALLAKGMRPFDAARLGARIAGEAGAWAARERGWGLMATDVVEAVPTVLASSLSASQGVRLESRKSMI